MHDLERAARYQQSRQPPELSNRAQSQASKDFEEAVVYHNRESLRQKSAAALAAESEEQLYHLAEKAADIVVEHHDATKRRLAGRTPLTPRCCRKIWKTSSGCSNMASPCRKPRTWCSQILSCA
jgi:hypothetical protein